MPSWDTPAAAPMLRRPRPSSAARGDGRLQVAPGPRRRRRACPHPGQRRRLLVGPPPVGLQQHVHRAHQRLVRRPGLVHGGEDQQAERDGDEQAGEVVGADGRVDHAGGHALPRPPRPTRPGRRRDRAAAWMRPPDSRRATTMASNSSSARRPGRRVSCAARSSTASLHGRAAAVCMVRTKPSTDFMPTVSSSRSSFDSK